MNKNGKLSTKELHKYVLDNIDKKNSEVIVGAQIGGDCAVISTKKDILITTDPITASNENLGLLGVVVNANDLAASGAKPLCMTLTVIAPTFSTVEDIAKVVKETQRYASNIGVDIVGGHTEFSDAVNRIIISITMLGVLDGYSEQKVLPKDSIIVTKYLGLESTAILINDKIDSLDLTCQERTTAKETLDMLCVLKDAEIAKNNGALVMHDITEGGVVGAVNELCYKLHLGAELDSRSFPYLDVTKKICSQLHIDRDRETYCSGSMLIVSRQPQKLIEQLALNDIKATIIGEITDKLDVVVK